MAAQTIRMRIVYFDCSQPEPCNADLMSLCIQQKLGCNGANHENQAEQEHSWKSRFADEVIKQKFIKRLTLTNIINIAWLLISTCSTAFIELHVNPNPLCAFLWTLPAALTVHLPEHSILLWLDIKSTEDWGAFLMGNFGLGGSSEEELLGTADLWSRYRSSLSLFTHISG